MSDHTKRVYDSILELLSSVENPTPLVRIQRVSPFQHTQVYAKLEWYNPFGAVKDRIAAQLIRDAEERGVKLEHLVEPTSGNTGMALAMLANARRLDFTATLSIAIPAEKRAALRAFGAHLVELSDDLCPMPGAPEGAMEKANEIARQPGWHQLNQYKNPANPEAHFRTTGPEVWRQTDGKITHFVAGLGTCGTITGTGRFLKSQSPNVKVLGVHPSEGHDIPGVRSRRALKLTDFFLPQEYDGVLEIGNDAAYQMCKRLNQEESLIAGPSSGMALAGAFQLVPDEPGAICVVMFPDNVFKYISSLRKHLPELFPADAAAADGADGGDAGAGAAASEAGAAASDAGAAAARPGGAATRGPDEVAPTEAARMIREGAALIDVRTPGEFMDGHLPEAVNIPLQALERGPVNDLPPDKSTPIVTICATGRRSIVAVDLLRKQGYTRVFSSRGGMRDWMAEVQAQR